MAAVVKENLDERIERIKKRNEEIEKKYREAEEDRLMALKDNAMVETKPPKDEDWPKGHKYDKIDFTYDVKPEKLEELKQKKQEEIKNKRDYRKFPDGEGPPPDPAYNFLADAERDGILPIKNDNKNDKRDLRQNNKNKELHKRGGPNNNSFRGRNNKTGHNQKYQKQNSQPEYEQWRSEREKIDEARINRQKIGDGKWKREWDNDKINTENDALLKPERITLGDAINSSGIKRSPTHSGNGKHNNHHHQQRNINSADCLIEKRGNITVSVSQTGEVKSVKLTSAPVIGTGRVGPRQHSKTQFSVQTIEKDVKVHQVPSSPRLQNKQYKISNSNQNNQNVTTMVTPVLSPTNPVSKQKRKPQSQTQNVLITDPSLTSTTTPYIPENPINNDKTILPVVDLSHKPEFAKKSVQDRLIRIRQGSNQNDSNNTKLNNINDLNDSSKDDDLKEETNDDLKITSNGNTNETIQTAEPIAACN